MPRAPEALDQRLAAVGEDPLQAELAALALRTISRAASASRTWSASASRSRAVTTARPACSAYRLEHAALRLARAPAVGRAGRSTSVPRSVALVVVAAGRSAGPAGARRRARRAASTSGTQPQVSPTPGSRRSCGTKRSRPHSSAFSISAHQPVDRGAGAQQLVAGLVAAGDRHHLELAVVADHADRGDAEAGELGDALGDSLQRVARGRVGPGGPVPAAAIGCSARVSARHRRLVVRPVVVAHVTWHHGLRWRSGHIRSRRRVPPNGSAPRPRPLDSGRAPPQQPRKGGDGRLTAALDPHDQGPQDACGVFGVWAPGEDVAKLTYFGLYALQHRGQESAGIAVSNGRQILVYKDMGLVSQVFDESTLESLKGHLAIGHARYSTTGASTWQNAQPTFRPTDDGSIALGHNGNLINTHELAPDGRRPARAARRARAARPRPRGLDQRHRPGHGAARAPPRHLARAARARGAARCCAAPSPSSG